MADKLKLTKETADKLNFLSTRLNMRRNVICRIAIGMSFSQSTPVEDHLIGDTQGYEFNRATVMGSEEYIFMAIATHIQGHTLSEDIFFNVIVRNHIERGIAKLLEDYERTNSPTDFVKKLLTNSL